MQHLPFSSYQDFAHSISMAHKAPFQPATPFSPQQWQSFRASQQKLHALVPSVPSATNVKANRDLNPWSKATVALAVNPSMPKNLLVLTNDYRESFSHQYYHVSQNAGVTWHDDALTNGIDAATSSPYNLQTNPGVAFDSNGNSFFSMLSANIISDSTTGYSNFDTQIDVVQGYNRGNFSSSTTSTVDFVPCNGVLSPTIAFNCPGQLQRPLITVDTQPNSPHLGTVYVYYTYFCNGVTVTADNTSTPQPVQPCIDNGVTIPPLASAILEADSPGPGMPFGKPRLVSNSTQNQSAYPTMVIDQLGQPHIFFEDFTSYPTSQLFVASLRGDNWQSPPLPLVSMQYLSLGNNGWNFFGNSNPGCSSFHMLTYCSFTANKVNNGLSYATPSVYLLSVNLSTSATSLTRVNADPPNDLKSHFFPWSSTNSHGDVYVGWYDNRHDPKNVKVEYFVAKSSDHGSSFRHQQPVSDMSFNPCVGSPYCGYFGDYNQLVTGTDNVTHAAWIDTRDGASAQVYSQAITW